MRILYAEDNQSMALPVIAFLQEQGHEVRHAKNGKEAVSMFREELPDLVLMDGVMPELSGVEATRIIKTLHKDQRWVPIVIMTALSADDELIAGLSAGADDYLTKPINFEVLNARISAMQRITQIQDTLRGIFDHAYEGMITINQKAHITSFNKAAETIFGYAAEDVIGKNINVLMPEPYHSAHDGFIQRYLKEGNPRIMGQGRKVRGLRKNGETFAMELGVTEVKAPKGSTFIGMVRDISAEEHYRQRIEYMALHDALTKLPNRVRFMAVLDAAAKRASQQPAAVLYMDLDGFKEVNDTYGHEAGDQVLVAVAARLQQALDDGDTVARLGGDEFVALFNGVEDVPAALEKAEALFDVIGRPIMLTNNVEVRVGASLGLALMPSHGSTANSILSAADGAMYAAKHSGKNEIMVASAVGV